MESYVNCPECGKQVRVILESSAGMCDFFNAMGLGKTNEFHGENKCECGKLIVASLHVTCHSIIEDEKNNEHSNAV
jgi:hypothetical protein